MSNEWISTPLLSETIWRAKAEKYQNSINEILGNRYFDSFPKSFLREKVEFALFGPPPYNADQLDSESVKTIDKLVSHITLLSDKIRPQCTGTIYMEYTFINLRYKNNNNQIDIQVLFRIPTHASHTRRCMFVDSTCRTYEDWADYLENNQLPKCDMCFPRHGIYSLNGDFSVDFAKSPACKIGKSIMKGLDVTSSLVGITATGITLAALAVPIAGPIVVGAAATAIASSTFEIGRGVDKLVDRKKHNETIGLDDGKSRKIWFDVATSALGAVSVGGRALVKGKSAIKIGQIVIETETMAARFLKFSSVAISGVGIVNMIISSINKIRKGEFLGIVDIKQFKSTFLFCFNVLLSDEAIGWLLRKIASLTDVKNKLSFSSKSISFSSVKNLYEFSSSPGGKFDVLLGMVRYSMKWIFDANLSELDSIINRMVFIASRIATGAMSVAEGVDDLSLAYKQLWHMFQLSLEEATIKVKNLFNFATSFRHTSSPARSLLLSNPDSARELCLLSLEVIEHCEIEDLHDYFMKEIFFLLDDFINPFYYKLTTVELSKVANFVCYKLKKLFDNATLKYTTSLALAKQRLSSEFDYAKFNEERRIPNNVDIKCFFLNEAIHEFYFDINSREKDRMFKNLCRQARDEPNTNAVAPCLETNSSKHFLFRGPRCEESLTDNQYWQMALDLSGFDFNIDNATIHRYDKYVYIVPNENKEIELIFYNTRDERNYCVAGVFSVINSHGVT